MRLVVATNGSSGRLQQRGRDAIEVLGGDRVAAEHLAQFRIRARLDEHGSVVGDAPNGTGLREEDHGGAPLVRAAVGPAQWRPIGSQREPVLR